MSCDNSVQDDVKEYYGKTLKSTDDLQSTACSNPIFGMHKHVKEAIAEVHEEVIKKYFGCGLSIPDCLEGMNILDLGSGAGRDCFALAKLVGSNGFVTGVDMTDEQLAVADKYVEYHQKKFGYDKANTKFMKAYIEDLNSAGIQNESVDIIISNCVVNLCKDKKKVLQEAYRVLDFGGELFFSDIYADREMPEEVRQHKVLWGEGIGGALHWKTLFEYAQEIGFEAPRAFTISPFKLTQPELIEELKSLIGEDAKFAAVTYRLFKLKKGQVNERLEVIYNGKTTGCPDKLKFDRNLSFCTNKPTVLDAVTSGIIKQSRLSKEFSIKEAPSCAKECQVSIVDPFNDLTEEEKATSCSNKPACS